MDKEKLIRDYIDARCDHYIKKLDKGEISKEEEAKLYDNIIELCSMCDYIYMQLTLELIAKIGTVRSGHKRFERGEL